MRFLVLAALATLVCGDVSHLAHTGYNYPVPGLAPTTSYGVPFNSVPNLRNGNFLDQSVPSDVSSHIQLPVHEHSQFQTSFGQQTHNAPSSFNGYANNGGYVYDHGGSGSHLANNEQVNNNFGNFASQQGYEENNNGFDNSGRLTGGSGGPPHGAYMLRNTGGPRANINENKYKDFSSAQREGGGGGSRKGSGGGLSFINTGNFQSDTEKSHYQNDNSHNQFTQSHRSNSEMQSQNENKYQQGDDENNNSYDNSGRLTGGSGGPPHGAYMLRNTGGPRANMNENKYKDRNSSAQREGGGGGSRKGSGGGLSFSNTENFQSDTEKSHYQNDNSHNQFTQSHKSNSEMQSQNENKYQQGDDENNNSFDNAGRLTGGSGGPPHGAYMPRNTGGPTANINENKYKDFSSAQREGGGGGSRKGSGGGLSFSNTANFQSDTEKSHYQNDNSHNQFTQSHKSNSEMQSQNENKYQQGDDENNNSFDNSGRLTGGSGGPPHGAYMQRNTGGPTANINENKYKDFSSAQREGGGGGSRKGSGGGLSFSNTGSFQSDTEKSHYQNDNSYNQLTQSHKSNSEMQSQNENKYQQGDDENNNSFDNSGRLTGGSGGPPHGAYMQRNTGGPRANINENKYKDRNYSAQREGGGGGSRKGSGDGLSFSNTENFQSDTEKSHYQNDNSHNQFTQSHKSNSEMQSQNENKYQQGDDENNNSFDNSGRLTGGSQQKYTDNNCDNCQSPGSLDANHNNEYFGNQYNTESDQSNIQTQSQKVSKHLYFFSAPEEPEEHKPRIAPPVIPAKKNIKVIFIKTPSYAAPAPIQIPAQQQNEEKTLVYVLVKKPEEAAPIEYQTPEPTQPSKPEVFFIKYKTQQEAEDAVKNVQTAHLSGDAQIGTQSVEGTQSFLDIRGGSDANFDTKHLSSVSSSAVIDNSNNEGGWYILRDWTDTDLDPNLILHLHVKYGVTPYFKISVDPNPQMPGQRSIRISPSGLGLPNKEYYYTNEEDRRPAAYMDFIKDVIIYLDTAGAEAAKFGRDMFSYEKRIAEITPDLQTLQNPITTYNSYTISELKQTVHNIPFHDILLAMYPESNISENTEVIVSSMDYLTQISHIISSTDKRTMNGYLIWTLVRNYIPFLSDKFIATFDTFQAELLGRQKPLQRWEVCAQLVQNVMGLATEVLLEQSYPLEQTTIKVANNTINSVLNVVKNRIAKFKNTPDLYKQLKLKLNTVRFFIGLPDSVKSDSYLKNYYLKLKIIKTDFFDSVRNGFTFQKKIEERLLMKSSLDESIISFATVPKPEVSYLASDNAIVIPRSLVSKDLFESEFPKAIIYGRLGVEIAKALVSSILPYDGLWTADKKLLSTFHMTVNESLASVKPASRCLSNYILNLNLPVPYNIANETALSALKHISAVSIANEALMQSLNEEHVHQPGLEAFEDSALFFLSFVQTLCGESSNQQQFFDLIERFELPSKTLLLLTWTQLPEFPEAFVCTFNKKLQCSDIL